MDYCLLLQSGTVHSEAPTCISSQQPSLSGKAKEILYISGKKKVQEPSGKLKTGRIVPDINHDAFSPPSHSSCPFPVPFPRPGSDRNMERVLKPLIPGVLGLKEAQLLGWEGLPLPIRTYRIQFEIFLLVREAVFGSQAAFRVERGGHILEEAFEFLDGFIQRPELAKKGHVQLSEPYLKQGRKAEG